MTRTTKIIILVVVIILAVVLAIFVYLTARRKATPVEQTAKRVEKVEKELNEIEEAQRESVSPQLRDKAAAKVARVRQVLQRTEAVELERRIYYGGDLVPLPSGEQWTVPHGLLMMVQKNQTEGNDPCVPDQKSYLDVIKHTKLFVPCHVDIDSVTRWKFLRCLKETRVDKVEVDPTCDVMRFRYGR